MLLELGKVELTFHLGSGRNTWDTCVWLLAPSLLVAFLLSHPEQGRVFSAGSTSRPPSP